MAGPQHRPPGARLERFVIAQRRLANILSNSIVASDRMLEQKISDAGPTNQRIDPHILTVARRRLVQAGRIIQLTRHDTPWFHLSDADPARVRDRLALLEGLHRRTVSPRLAIRLGQALEIAVFKAFASQNALHYLGGFPDLDQHDDASPFSKVEPPSFLDGRTCGAKQLDFIALVSGTFAGVEVKNTRPWVYPDSEAVKALLLKCCALDIVPILIARRIHYSTFSVLNPCGVLVHQTFNQRYPLSAATLAARVRDKELLGYHDVRVGNDPDPRLLRFMCDHLPKLIPSARPKFDRFKDLLAAYADGDHSYKSFSARVKRRLRGEPEDGPGFESEELGDVDGHDTEDELP